ncbi:MAG: prenyltransferase, partial [Burkholderiales bacterium]
MIPARQISFAKPRLWLGAFAGFYRPSAEVVRGLDPVSKFLYSARSVILVISAQAAIIAGLLAAAERRFQWPGFALVLVGFVAAHMISNLSNDYFGYRRGHDTPDSPRMRYTVHPLASGVLEARTLLVGLAILAAIGAGISAFFIVERGWTAAAFLAAGVALLLLYDAAPVPLKAIGLGEPAVFLVWGPLMVGGGYAMIAGSVSANAFWASIPYGLGVMSILTGKHIDQREFDTAKGNRTLPVLVGEKGARALNGATVILMYAVAAALIAAGTLTPFAAAVA